MSEEPKTIRLFGTAVDSIVDGPGLRFSIFVQGCSHHCPGCHNPESQPQEGGFEKDIDELVCEIDANKLTQGVTLSGGEPFEQCAASLAVAKKLKERGYALWVYSGYRYEDLMAGKPDPLAPELLACADVLVDGPFVEALHSYDLLWKGSSNQRLIDVPSSKEANQVVTWEHKEDFPEAPTSW